MLDFMGESFLLNDSGSDDPLRFLVFGTTKGLHYLASNGNWAIDGTFKSASVGFYQLVTIHMFIKQKSVPRVYALMSGKTCAQYRRLYQVLKTLNENLKPNLVSIDFEQANLKALRQEFQDSTVSGCLFHLAQSVYQKTVEFGLKREYHDDPDFSHMIRHLPALALIPECDVIPAFEELSESELIPDQLIEYFSETYIGTKIRRNKRADPLFDISFWNMTDRLIDNIQRTNNPLKGFHSSLNRIIGAPHPNLWKLIGHLKTIETLSQKKIIDFNEKRRCRTSNMIH